MTQFSSTSIKSFWQVKKLEVIGRYQRIDDNHGLLVDLICEDNILLHPISGKRIKVIAQQVIHPFKDFEYYQFTLTFSRDVFNLDNNTHIPMIVSVNSQIINVSNPYQDIINKCFIRFEEPDSNKVIARLLQEVGRGMYSSKKRMFFELLQNADDQPVGESPVKVHIETLQNYFLFMHDGTPFSGKDVRSITSAAESTKEQNRKKTGYKGIGFKSVFSDTSKVVIKSGGFLFAFDKNNPVFRSFEEMYINRHELYSKNEDARDYFLNKYQGRKREFEDIRTVPWQIKPIWIEQVGRELNESSFNHLNNVGIAIHFGAEKVKGYSAEVVEVMADPRFLLFLRNVNFVQHNNAHRRIEAARSKNLSEVSLKENGDEIHRYRIKEFRKQLSNEAFTELGLDIRLGSKHVQYDSDLEERVFFNVNGDELTDIPPKIAMFEEISISFAAPMNGTKVIPEASYLIDERRSYVFTYLPMKEDRLKFPFLVNTDFVPSSNREAIQGDNVWNHFLFYHIGFCLVEWVAELAANPDNGDAYLNLLVPKLLTAEGSDIKEVEKWFNQGYQKGISEIPFISSGKDSRLLKCEETILDTTGLTSVFSHDLFYQLTETSLHLPLADLEVEILENDLFRIKKFTDKELYEILKTDGPKRKLFETAIQNLDETGYQGFLSWLNDWFGQLSESHRNYIAVQLRIFRFSDDLLAAWNTLNEPNKPHFGTHIVNQSRFSAISTTLSACGSQLTEFKVDKEFPQLQKAINPGHSYINNDVRLFDLMTKIIEIGRGSLTGLQKTELLSFIASLDQVGPEKYAQTLALFKSQTGIYRPLGSLITSLVPDLPSWLKPWVIDAEEEGHLQAFSKHLVDSQTLFEKIYLIQSHFAELTTSIGENDLADFNAHILDAYAAHPEKEKIKTAIGNIPWLFTDAEKRFKKAGEIYCPEVIRTGLSFAKYQNVKRLLYLGTNWSIPHFDSLSLISGLKLNCESHSISGLWFRGVEKIPEEMMLYFLEILSEANEPDFFKKWYIVLEEGGFQIKPKVQEFKQNVIANGDMKAWIENNPILLKHLEILDDTLVFDNLESLGILKDDALLKNCIKLAEPPISLIREVLKSANENIKKDYLLRLEEVPIDTEEEYSKDTDISKIMNLAVQFAKSDETGNFATEFRSKIKLDGTSLEKEAISDRVSIKLEDSSRYELSLSDILKDYKGESDVMAKALNAFPSINKSDLKKYIFCLKEKPLKDIESEIRSQSLPYITPAQIVFFILIAKKFERTDIYKDLIHFDNYFQDSDWNQVEIRYLELLNMLMKINLFDLKGGEFSFIDFDPVGCVFDELAVSREQAPPWVLEWLGPKEDQSKYNERLSFLFKLGINQTESSVVRLRQSMLKRDVPLCKTCVGEMSENEALLINSLSWLEVKQTQEPGLIGALLTVINDILEQIEDISVEELLVPIMTDFEVYQLVPVTAKKFHLYQNSWYPFRYSIIKHLKAKGEFTLPGNLPESIVKKLDPTKLSPETMHSSKLANAQEWNASHYTTWELRSEFPIYIYPENLLPWDIRYNGEVVTQINKEESTNWEGKFYVTANKAINIPFSLPNDFPYEHKYELIKRQNDDGERELPVDNTEPYVSTYETIIKGKNPSLDDQIEYNREATMRGLVFLYEQGYDLSKIFIENREDILRGIEKDGVSHNFFFRSARGGLLYLNPKYWLILGEKNTALVVIYPRNEVRIFNSKEELMLDQMNPYILIRTANTRKPEDIDKMIESTYGDTNLLFVTSHELCQKLYKDTEQRSGNPPVANRGIAEENYDI